MVDKAGMYASKTQLVVVGVLTITAGNPFEGLVYFHLRGFAVPRSD
jgi:hypothetical protein